MSPTPRWTSVEELQFRMGSVGDSPLTLVVALKGVLAGVEASIEQVVRSPVALKLIQSEWRAPVCDPRLLTRWRPINVADEDAGTADPILLSCTTPFDASTGTALTYGTDFVVYDRSGDDTRFGLAPMLELVGNSPWWFGGWGNSPGWTGTWVRPPTRLSNGLTSARGRLNLTYWAGWPDDAIPQAIIEAAYLEATTLWQMRKFGRLLSSESLNGYSYQTAAFPVPQKGASTRFINPTVVGMLQPWTVPAVAGISPW